MKVAEIRDRLVELGLSREQVNLIKGKKTLMNALDRCIQPVEPVEQVESPEPQDPLQLILGKLGGIEKSIGELEDRIESVETGETQKTQPETVEDDDHVVETQHLPGTKSRGRRWKKKKGPNKFKDDGLECSELTIDALNEEALAANPKAKLIPKKPLRMGNRPTAKKVTLQCSVCSKSELVFASMVPPSIMGHRPNYRCNGCSGQ